MSIAICGCWDISLSYRGVVVSLLTIYCWRNETFFCKTFRFACIWIWCWHLFMYLHELITFMFQFGKFDVSHKRYVRCGWALRQGKRNIISLTVRLLNIYVLSPFSCFWLGPWNFLFVVTLFCLFLCKFFLIFLYFFLRVLFHP